MIFLVGKLVKHVTAYLALALGAQVLKRFLNSSQAKWAHHSCFSHFGLI